MDSPAQSKLGSPFFDVDSTLLLPSNHLLSQSDFNLSSPPHEGAASLHVFDLEPNVDTNASTLDTTDTALNSPPPPPDATRDLFDPLLTPNLAASLPPSTPPSSSPVPLPPPAPASPPPLIELSATAVTKATPKKNKPSPSVKSLPGSGRVKKPNINNGVKPKHVCQVCFKSFKRAHNLHIHGRLHSGETPYKCPFSECGKRFRWKSSIVSHMNWHRTKRGEVLPGEPEDKSVQRAALRQGSSRGKKKKQESNNCSGESVEIEKTDSKEDGSKISTDNDMTTSGETITGDLNVDVNVTNKERDLNKDEQLEYIESTSESDDMKNMEMRNEEVEREQTPEANIKKDIIKNEEMLKETKENEGYEVEMDLDGLMVNVNVMDGICQSGQGAFTPSTTAEDVESGPALELEDLIGGVCEFNGMEGIEDGEGCVEYDYIEGLLK